MADTTVSKRPRRRTILAGAGLFHFFHDGIADGMVVFLPLWQAAFDLSLTHVGLLVSCFEGATGFFQIPAGYLGERTGERLLLTVGTLITAACFFAVGFIGGPAALVVLLVAGGAGAAVQHPLASSMVSNAYSGGGRRVALGTYNFTGDIGKFAFPAMAAVALAHVGWRPVCMGFGLFGVLLTGGLFLLLRGVRAGGGPPSNPLQTDRHRTRGWGIVNKKGFAALSAIGVVDTAVRVGLTAFAPFLLIQKGLGASSVGFALALLFVGGAAGKFLCGVLAERIGVVTTVVVTESVTGCGILLLTVLPLPAVYVFLPILGAALNGTSSVLYGTVADFVSAEKTARAFGLFYTFVIAAAAVAPPLMGRVSDAVGVGASIRLTGWLALAAVPLAGVLYRQMRGIR